MKLIAIDLDGTLLNDQHKISNYNEIVLKKLIKKNNRIVLASGRPFNSVLPFLKQLGLLNQNEYSIVFNGTTIVNNASKEIIYQETIEKSVVLKAFNLSKELNIGFFTYNQNQTIITNHITDYVLFEKDLTNSPLIISDFTNLEDSYIKITFTDAKERLDKLYKKIKNEFKDYMVVRSHDYFIELINKKASKGNALKYLLSYLNYSFEEIIAFGDNENDYSLLQIADKKYAMGNSTSQKLKQIADEVTKSNNDDGVGYILNKLDI